VLGNVKHAADYWHNWVPVPGRGTRKTLIAMGENPELLDI
jgi:hypothetical protein